MSEDSGSMTLPAFPLMDQQLELEERMVVIGRTQFYKDIERAKERGEESHTPYGIRLLQAAILPVAEGITEFVTEAHTGRPGRRQVALKMIEVLAPEIMAYLAVKFVLDGITKQDTLQRVAMRIADAIQDQVLLDKFQRTDKDRYAVTMETIKDATTRRRKQAISRLMAKRLGIHKEPWSATDKVLLGQKLIEIIQCKTGLVTIHRRTEGLHDTALYVTATEKTLLWIDNVRERLEMLSPQFLPMIVPPKPWTNAYPLEQQRHYMLMHQLTRITRDRGALAQDDRLDALAIAVAYWTEAMSRDEDKAKAAMMAKKRDEELRKFVNSFWKRPDTSSGWIDA